MISTASLIELQQIINSTHGDPHHILGMHEFELKGKKSLVVRAFNPQVKEITVIDANNPRFKYKMEKIHEDGFFEAHIPTRSDWFKYKLSYVPINGESWEDYDPYAFPQILTPLDLHLFGEGTHYEIYNKLGAHFMEIDGVQGVLFGVWAPNAKRVSVIGSFNSWDGRRNPMRAISSSGVWELFIPGLYKFDQYKFEIKTYNGTILQKTDPFGSFHELRPSTSSLIYDIDSYEWKDLEWIQKRNSHNPLKGPINIYEVHLGSWKRIEAEGNRFMSYLEAASELVPYVKEMGYTHIELMPVEEHPFDGSWGYQVTGYYAPTSRYGTPDEFMYFVDVCHQNDIGVILDWVPAHFPKDAHGLARFDGTALFEHEDPRKGEHPDWGTYIFNYGRKEVKNFLIGNAIFWLEKYHIDGLLVDAVASMLYLDYGKSGGEWVPNEYGGRENFEAVEFMKHMNSVILGRMPNALMIAEESTAWAGVSRPAEQNGLGFNLKWNMGWMNDFLTYISKDTVFRKYHHNDLTFSMVYAYTENFVLVLSHDEVVHGKGSLINKMPGDLWQKFANLRVALGFMYGHPGKKLIFMGGELAQFDEWSEERSIHWFLLDFDHHKKLKDFVHDMNHLYLEDEPLWYDDFEGNGFEWIDAGDWERSIATFFRKGKDGDITVFACNFTPQPYMDFRIGVPTKATYKEILNSDDTKYGGSGIINDEAIAAEALDWNGRKYSIPIKLPPLAISVFKPVGK